MNRSELEQQTRLIGCVFAAVLVAGSCGFGGKDLADGCAPGVPTFAYTAPAKIRQLRQSDVAVFGDRATDI